MESGRFFGLKELIESEIQTKAITRAELSGVANNYPLIIDVFFKLPYCIGKLEPVETPVGGFQAICFEHYVQAPYTFWTVYSLYEKGYYLESMILYRHLLEVLIQMKYFQKYPEKLKDHLLDKKRVSFKAMFDEFSPGFYKTWYGELLSGFAHGKIPKSIFRFERPSPAEATTIMGCKFDIRHSTYVINNTLPLLFGYLNHFDPFFPKNNVKDKRTIATKFLEAKKWLTLCIASHKKSYPQSIDWYHHMEKFIYY